MASALGISAAVRRRRTSDRQSSLVGDRVTAPQHVPAGAKADIRQIALVRTARSTGHRPPGKRQKSFSGRGYRACTMRTLNDMTRTQSRGSLPSSGLERSRRMKEVAIKSNRPHQTRFLPAVMHGETLYGPLFIGFPGETTIKSNWSYRRRFLPAVLQW